MTKEREVSTKYASGRQSVYILCRHPILDVLNTFICHSYELITLGYGNARTMLKGPEHTIDRVAYKAAENLAPHLLHTAMFSEVQTKTAE